MGRQKATPIALLRKQFKEFKRTGVVQTTSYRTARCYVCERKSPMKDMRYIGKNKDGDDVYRHEYCEAGSANWRKKFPNSSWRKYFPADDADDQQGHG